MTRSRSLSSSKLSNAIAVLSEERSRRSRSEVQACLAGSFGEGLDAAVIEIAVAVEDHPVDFLLDADLGDERPDLLRRVGLVLGALTLQVGRQRRRRRQRTAGLVADDLRVDVLRAAKHRQPRALFRAGDLVADAELAPLSSSQLLGHDRISPRVYLRPLPVLPALRRICSPRRRMPLPP